MVTVELTIRGDLTDSKMRITTQPALDNLHDFMHSVLDDLIVPRIKRSRWRKYTTAWGTWKMCVEHHQVYACFYPLPGTDPELIPRYTSAAARDLVEKIVAAAHDGTHEIMLAAAV